MTHKADLVCDTAGEQMLVRVRGEIDHHTAADIRNGIDGALFEKRPRRLIMDMSAVTFMDSSGLGLIMGRLSVIRELGGELVVQDPSEAISRIIALAGMERAIDIRYTGGERRIQQKTAARRHRKASRTEGEVAK
ncbi:MAG: STAS domain-containing protein [Ruminococcaceae bacterium]|nr:STAS domain-containing protein [Oscillospiraceae bacterium]